MKWSFRPKSRLGWWAFSLGLASLAWTLAVPSLYNLFGMLLAAAMRQPLLIPMAYALAIIDLALAAAALLVGSVALRGGERSWMSLLAFVPVGGRLVVALFSLLERSSLSFLPGRRAGHELVAGAEVPRIWG
jgi:hypothetical protein